MSAKRRGPRTRAGSWVEATLGRLIPARERESVIGDLHEEAAGLPSPPGAVWHLARAAGIAAHFHAEPYRDRSAFAGAALLTLVGLGLLWIVPLAGWPMTTPPPDYPGPVADILVHLWSAPHLTAALAAGLLAGHLPALSERASHARWHVAALLCAVSLIAWPGTAGLTAAAILTAGTWLGVRGLEEADTLSRHLTA